MLPRLPPGGSVSEGNHAKGMGDDSFLICLIDSMDPSDLKSDDFERGCAVKIKVCEARG